MNKDINKVIIIIFLFLLCFTEKNTKSKIIMLIITGLLMICLLTKNIEGYCVIPRTMITFGQEMHSISYNPQDADNPDNTQEFLNSPYENCVTKSDFFDADSEQYSTLPITYFDANARIPNILPGGTAGANTIHRFKMNLLTDESVINPEEQLVTGDIIVGDQPMQSYYGCTSQSYLNNVAKFQDIDHSKLKCTENIPAILSDTAYNKCIDHNIDKLYKITEDDLICNNDQQSSTPPPSPPPPSPPPSPPPPAPAPAPAPTPVTVTRTCADTNGDGTEDLFDCSGNVNDPHPSPATVECSGGACTPELCCTVPRQCQHDLPTIINGTWTIGADQNTATLNCDPRYGPSNSNTEIICQADSWVHPDGASINVSCQDSVDCSGYFSECDSNCQKTYNIDIPASNGGTPCPHSNGTIINCLPEHSDNDQCMRELRQCPNRDSQHIHNSGDHHCLSNHILRSNNSGNYYSNIHTDYNENCCEDCGVNAINGEDCCYHSHCEDNVIENYCHPNGKCCANEGIISFLLGLNSC